MGRLGGAGTAQVVQAVFGRRRPVPPTGVPAAWVSALDRFARSVHRFHDRVEVVPDRQVRAELVQCGARLESALTEVRGLSRGPVRGAGRGADRRDEAVPSVRGLLRSGTLCAHATECAMAAATASRNRDPVETRRCLDDVQAVIDELLGELAADWAAQPVSGERGRP